MAHSRRRTTTEKSRARALADASRARFTRIAAATLVVSGVIAYANSLYAPFIFDDRRAVIDNASILRLSSLPDVLAPQVQTPMAGRPVANLSLAINYAIGGLDPFGYHIWNLLTHVAAALVLFGLLRRLTAWVSPGDPSATDRWALVTASAWMLHPLNTESVTYVTQRTESMMGLFYLFTLYASVRAWDGGEPSRWRAAAIVANLCGMGSKEAMATAPVMVVLCDRVFRYASLADAFRARRTFYAALAAGWAVLVLFASQTPYFREGGFESDVSRWSYLLGQAPLVLHYLRLSVWPRALVLDYGPAGPVAVGEVGAALVAVIALIILAGLALWRLPKIGFWGAWFFITLAPASSLVPIPTEVGAERRMYLPLVGVLTVIVLSGRLAGQLAPEAVALRGRLVAMAAAVATVAALLVATIGRNAEYRSAVGIWQTVVDRRPHGRAHANLAVALRDAGRVDDAIAELRLAAPDTPEAKHALGSALLERGDVAEAVTHLDEFVRTSPDDPEIESARTELARARRQLVIVLLKEERFKEAEAEARALVSSGADDAEAHNLLGVSLASQDRVDEAAREFAEAVRLSPEFKDAKENLGRADSLRARPR